MDETYPLTYSVDYPDRELNRLTTFFRIFTLIPIAIVLGAVAHASYGGWNDQGTTYAAAGGLLIAGPLLMILFRKKYPRWWFDWNRELLRFSNRSPSIWRCSTTTTHRPTSSSPCIWRSPTRTSRPSLGRGMPLVKWLLAIPHYIVLFFLTIGAFFAVIFAWFAILFTGRYPSRSSTSSSGWSDGTTG